MQLRGWFPALDNVTI